MPMDRSRHPRDWPVIALEIKTDADWTCQHCGKSCIRPGEDKAALFKRIQGTQWEAIYWEFLPEGGRLAHPQRFRLTTAHLNHQPMDCRKENLRAWCISCHARYDTAPQAMAIKQLLRQGYDQMSLF